MKNGFQSHLKIEKLKNGKYKLLSDLSYGNITAPAGFVCDLASFKIGNLSLRGKTEEPSVIHDWLYSRQNTSGTDRKTADDVFLKALLSVKEHPLKARLYWLVVRLAGWKFYKK